MYKKHFFAPYFLLMSAFFIISLKIQDLTFYMYYLTEEKCFIRYFEVNTLNYAKCGSNTIMIT